MPHHPCNPSDRKGSSAGNNFIKHHPMFPQPSPSPRAGSGKGTLEEKECHPPYLISVCLYLKSPTKGFSPTARRRAAKHRPMQCPTSRRMEELHFGITGRHRQPSESSSIPQQQDAVGVGVSSIVPWCLSTMLH